MVYKSKNFNSIVHTLLFSQKHQPVLVGSGASRRFFGATNPSMLLKTSEKASQDSQDSLAKQDLITGQDSQSALKSTLRPLLNFVRDHQPRLQQLYTRFPNDGHFPRIKEFKDYTKEDVKEALSLGKMELLSEVIKALDQGTVTCTPDFLAYFVAQIYDKSYPLCKELYERLGEIQMPLSPIVLNFLLMNAAISHEYSQINQLMTEATLSGVQIDLNTYLRILTTVYFDYEVPFDRKEFITQIYILFANDHYPEDFQLATELLQEYIENNFADFQNFEKQQKKKKNKKGNKSEKKSGQESADIKMTDQIIPDQDQAEAINTAYQETQEVTEDNEDDDDDDDTDLDEPLAHLGPLPSEQINDLLQQKRTNLYKSQMSKSKNKLKKQNTKAKNNNLQLDKTSKHINKYDNNLDQLMDKLQHQVENDGDYTRQLVVDIGSLKDIDHSPGNIKELSKMMADQIANLLTKESEKMNKAESQRKSKAQRPVSNQTQTKDLHQAQQDRVLKFDISQFKAKNTPTSTQSGLASAINSDKFTLETFYSALDNQQRFPSHATAKNLAADAASYLTTQEEATTEGHTLLSRTQVTQEKAPYDTDAREDHARKTLIREEFDEALTEKESSGLKTPNSSGDEKPGNGSIPHKK